MPLKHGTETALVAILGIAMALAGVVVAVLSALTSPGLFWIGAFLIALAYPLVLYPHFRDARADYEFRILHFVPALFLLVWLLLTILGTFFPVLTFFRGILSFGWALPLVALGFLLLAWFAMHVIRQWPKRVGMLILLFAPFLLLGLYGERLGWNTQLASLIDDKTPPIAVTTSSSSSLGAVAVASAKSRTSVMISSRPPQLPHSGGGLELFAVIVPAATCAAVQIKTLKRLKVRG